MTSLVCENCATPLPGGSKFCNECGTPVPGVSPALRRSAGLPTDLRQALQMATAGEYEIHHELGRGGMGSVFLAREIGLDRLVAIKVLPPSLMFDEGLIVRFKREARMVAKLHHPNIIPVYRVHHSHNLAFYTMHFVAGRSLSEIMSSGQPTTLPDIERIMLEGAAGLGYAHKRGVIHRDVKPANILLDAENHAHLTDFGIAKALVGDTQLTETGAVIGTPQYMAPEQCDGRMVDGRADQYSLAVVGYQLLTGRPPFESDSMKELLYQHLFTSPKPLGAARPETPVSLRDAIHKALSKDPADRFDSMEDFRTAIEGKGPPIFVKWIDGESEGSQARSMRKRFRRSTDLPTTERLPEAPWATNGREAEVHRLSVYQRTLAALAVAVITIGAIAGIALTRGTGLAGSLRPERAAEDGLGEVSSLSAVDAGERAETPRGTLPSGGEASPSADGESGELVAANRLGRVVLSGTVPAGAVVKVDGEALGEPLVDGAGVDLPVGTHRVDVSAAGFATWSSDVDVVLGEEVVLSVTMQRQRPAEPLTQVESLPAVPASLLDELQGLMQQASVLHDAGKYVAAAETFDEVQTRATQELGNYRDDDVLKGLIERAKDGREKAHLTCVRYNKPRCP